MASAVMTLVTFVSPCRSSDHQEQVIQELTLTGEIKQNTKGEDSEALLCGEVLVLVAQVLELVGVGVQNLNVGREVLVTPERGEVLEILVCDVGKIQLVIACVLAISAFHSRLNLRCTIHTNGQKIVVDILENNVGY
jgi:hypothetical protein